LGEALDYGVTIAGPLCAFSPYVVQENGNRADWRFEMDLVLRFDRRLQFGIFLVESRGDTIGQCIGKRGCAMQSKRK
jgi:hypothetical protein